MNTVWIVTWFVVLQMGCPPPPPDPYGRQINSMEAVYCTERVVHKKEFATEKEAKNFVAQAPKDWTLSDFTITEKKQP